MAAPPPSTQAPPPPQPQTTSAEDAKAYYGYLFEADKKPTKVLDALLRGVAGYISESIGNPDEKSLTPDKLASFYKAVGGNYDSLFLTLPHPSISWIYSSIGCQHTLLPSSNDFAPPSIPALTPRGFVRWQSIEILLGPEEHVPFIQKAIRLFPILHPTTGTRFPLDLPKAAFPLVPDESVARWHERCARELRQRASPGEEEGQRHTHHHRQPSSEAAPESPEGIRPHLPPRPKTEIKIPYSHVRPPQQRSYNIPSTSEHEYFEPKSRGGAARPVAYHHVSSAGIRTAAPVPVSVNIPVRPGMSQSPSHRARQFLAPEDSAPRTARGRRRSFPENATPSPASSPVLERDEQKNDLGREEGREGEGHGRRHSHPRHARRGSMSEDASSSEDGSPSSPIAERRRRRRADTEGEQRPPFAVRYSMAPPERAAPEETQQRARPRRKQSRERDNDEEERKRRSFPIPIDITGKLSAPFMLGKRDSGHRERERRKVRSSSRSGGSGGNVRWKDLDGPEMFKSSLDDEGEKEGKGRYRDERESEYRRRDRDRQRDSRRGSYEDPGRGSGRDKSSGRESGGREREREGIVNGRVPPAVPEGTRYRDRDRDSGREREGARPRERDRERRHAGSPMRGVDGRRYPSGH